MWPSAPVNSFNRTGWKCSVHVGTVFRAAEEPPGTAAGDSNLQSVGHRHFLSVWASTGWSHELHTGEDQQRGKETGRGFYFSSVFVRSPLPVNLTKPKTIKFIQQLPTRLPYSFTPQSVSSVFRVWNLIFGFCSRRKSVVEFWRSWKQSEMWKCSHWRRN